MRKVVDCLFIGHNEMRFDEYEEVVRKMGVTSGAYRDLNFNFLTYQDKVYTISDFYNEFNTDEKEEFNIGEIFSLTIGYLASYLHERGISFDFVNSFQGEKEKLIEKLQRDDILTIVIPTTLYTAPFPVIEIIELVKKYNKTAKIIIGGPYIASKIRDSKHDTLEYFFRSINADIYVNSSQGEYTLFRVIEALKNNKSLDPIENIIYRNEEIYTINPLKIEDNKLEDNMIKWQLFKEDLGELATIRTSISCPFSCAFCGFPQHAGAYQVAKMEAIEEELNRIHSLGRVKRIQFIDDTFNIPNDRFKEILKMMIRNKYDFKWNSYYRCQYADEETIQLMKESGCEGVFLGIESGSQHILNLMNKKATIERYKKGIELLNKYDITTFASFIIGFPGETKETIKETIQFIEETRPTFYRAQLWYCDPVTPIYEEKDRYHIEGSQFNWKHHTMDFNEACEAIDQLVLRIDQSIYLPMYNFDFNGIFRLFNRGMDLETVKDFVNHFNIGIKDKLKTSKQEISYDLYRKLQKACSHQSAGSNNEIQNKYNADFDF